MAMLMMKDYPARPELDALIERSRVNGITDEMLREQRISFAYGNAPENSTSTKESVREAAGSIRIKK